jgi:hypothetical protein
MQIKHFFGYIFIAIHRYIVTIVYIYLLLFNFDFALNLALVLLTILIIFFWYIFNGCIFNVFENYLIDKKMSSIFEKKITFGGVTMFEHVVYSPATYMYLLFALGGLYKLHYIYKRDRKETKKDLDASGLDPR